MVEGVVFLFWLSRTRFLAGFLFWFMLPVALLGGVHVLGGVFSGFELLAFFEVGFLVIVRSVVFRNVIFVYVRGVRSVVVFSVGIMLRVSLFGVMVSFSGFLL